jgi:hypothetical protein
VKKDKCDQEGSECGEVYIYLFVLDTLKVHSSLLYSMPEINGIRENWRGIFRLVRIGLA